MDHRLTGTSIIGWSRGSVTPDKFRAFDPTTGGQIEPPFYSATKEELELAASLADAARIPYGNIPGADRAVFLRKIADNIEALDDTLIERASLETSLPNARFEGERS